jgi:predicted DNA-binding protein with PD1-like motif
MKKFVTEGLGRTLVIELDRGEKIVEGICAALEEAGIKNAIVGSVVGSVQKLVYHRPTDMGAAAADEMVVVEQPMEIGSLTGSVFDGAAHFHFVAADPTQTYCGHLEPGSETMYLLEVTMVEITGCNLERRTTPEKVKKLFEKE